LLSTWSGGEPSGRQPPDVRRLCEGIVALPRLSIAAATNARGEPAIDELRRRAQEPLLRFGAGILPGALREESRRFALLTQPAPARSIEPAARRRATVERMVDSLAEDDLRVLEHGLPDADLVVGVGGGLVMDAAKFVAWRRGLPLLLAPSVVSVDACVTNTIAIRRHGTVEYDGFVVAEAILVDFDVIRHAPVELNRAGVGDLLSIHTGLHDWRLGAARGRAVFDDAIAGRSAAVLDRIDAIADEIGSVTDGALEAIVRAYAEINALCLRAGHSQLEEGSEHYFAYSLESVAGHGFVHGEVVGLGTMLMATLQGNDPARARRILARSRVDWSLERLAVNRDDVLRTLSGLATFVRAANLPYSIVDEVEITGPVAEGLLDAVLEAGEGWH
jgi:glycerol-1-phosphate dehydrogenase [NAD(P)+]